MFPLQYPHAQPPLFSGPVVVGRHPMFPLGSSGGSGSAPSTPPTAPASAPPQHGGGSFQVSSTQAQHHYLLHAAMMQARHLQAPPVSNSNNSSSSPPPAPSMSPLLMPGAFPNTIMFPCLPQPMPLFSYPGTAGSGHHSDRSRGATPSGDSEGSSRLQSRAATQAKKSRRRQLDRSPAKQQNTVLAGAATATASRLQPMSGLQPSIRRSQAPKIMHNSTRKDTLKAELTGITETPPVVVVDDQIMKRSGETYSGEDQLQTNRRLPTPPPAPIASGDDDEACATIANVSDDLIAVCDTAAATLPIVATAAAMVSPRPADIKDLDEHRIAQRVKQINFGKVTDGYRHYRHAVPPCRRQLHNPRHPDTPDIRAPCSKRKWDQEVAVWRRSLHQWDTNPEESSMRDPECTHYYTHHAEMSMEDYARLTEEELQRVHDEVAKNHGGVVCSTTAASSAAPGASGKKNQNESRGGGGGGFCSTTAGETEVSTDEHSAAEESRSVGAGTRQHVAAVSALDDMLLSRGATPKWELGCAMFDYSPPATAHRRHRSTSALSPIRPVGGGVAGGGHHPRHSPVRTTISWSESRCPDVPRVRIPVNYHHQGSRVRPLVLVMDGTGDDPMPIYEKLCATFQLEHLFVESQPEPSPSSSSGAIALAVSREDGSSPTTVAPATSTTITVVVDSVEQVLRLIQQGKRHDTVLSLPKLTYRGELVHPRSHFFEQIDDIQREMLSMTPTSHRQILVSGAPTTPDRLTFTVASASAVQYTPSMSAVKVSTTPHSFCFQTSSFGGLGECAANSLRLTPT